MCASGDSDMIKDTSWVISDDPTLFLFSSCAYVPIFFVLVFIRKLVAVTVYWIFGHIFSYAANKVLTISYIH